MSKRPIIIIGTILVIAAAQKLLIPAVKKTLANASVATSVYAFTPAEIEQRLKKIEAALPAIEKLIGEGKYQDGRELFDRTFVTLRRAQRHSADALGKGRTLAGELQRLETPIGAAAHGEFERLVAKIAQGDTDTARMQRLIRSFSTVGGQNLGAEFTTRSPAFDQVRRTLAARWIRINIDETSEDYEAITRDYLLKTLVLPPGFSLVFGPATGAAEDAATFATVTLKVHVNVQRYLVRPITPPGETGETSFFNNHTDDGLLESITVVITTRQAFKAYASTWDHLPGKVGEMLQFNVTLPTPEEFEFNIPKGEDVHDVFKARNVTRVKAMKTKLTAALKAFPPLDFATEKNSVALLSRQNALFNEASFLPAASAALAAKQSVGEIACIAVELMLEPLAGGIESQLDRLTPVERSQLAAALRVRPWYHDFATLTQLVASTPNENAVGVMEALQRDLDRPALMKAARTRVLQETNPREQARLLGLLVSYSPSAALPDFVQLYATLEPVPQSAILIALMSRDRAMAGKFAQQLVQSSNPAVRQQVCDALESALSTINSGRKMALLPDEIAVFMQAATLARGDQREHMIAKLPYCEELLSQLLESNRGSWTEAENLELYDRCCNGPLIPSAAREAQIMTAVFQSVKAGRLNSIPLTQKATRLLSPIANHLLRTRGDENVKIPLLLLVIDERSRPNSEICAQSVVSIISSLQSAGVLAHADARTLLVKGKAYADEPNWAKFMGPQTAAIYGKDYPGASVRAKMFELLSAAAIADPRYRDL